MAAHAVLGASSSSRWLACPGSIRLSADMPNTSSAYAREGSCAHEVASECLIHNQDAISWLGKKVEKYPEIEVTEDMCNAVQRYLDTVREQIKEYGRDDFELDVELRFDLEHIYPGMFGTCDAVVYLPQTKRLTVYDYKHGWVGVAAERNAQTMYYALGALTGKHNRLVEEIELVIVQPRSGKDGVKRWVCDVIDMLDFRIDLIEGAKKTESSDAPLNPGSWCKFCPAAAICPALANLAYEKALAEFNIDDTVKPMEPQKMSLDKLKLAWENAAIIEDWAKAVKSYAHEQALQGNVLPGCKLVRGRKGRKAWKDEEQAKAVLTQLSSSGAVAGSIYTGELKTPTQIEKQVTDKKLLASLWTQAEGGLSLVSADDERPDATITADTEF